MLRKKHNEGTDPQTLERLQLINPYGWRDGDLCPGRGAQGGGDGVRWKRGD